MPVLKDRKWTEEEKQQLASALPVIQEAALKNLLGPITAMNEYVTRSLKPILEFQKMFILQLPTFPVPLNFSSSITVEERNDAYEGEFKRIYRRHPNFWLEETSDGRFKYKGRFIGKISVGSKVGKFLRLLIDEDNNFVSDNEVRNEIELADNIKGIGFIKNDLIKAFKNDGIEIKFLRVRNIGNKIVKVSRSTN